jgi:membrane protein involved in colicin uptake
MKKALIISVFLHLLLFSFLLFDFEKPQPKISSTLHVDFVSIGPKTAAPKITKKPAAAPQSENNDSSKIEISKIKKTIEKEEKKPEPKPKEDPKPVVVEKQKDKNIEPDQKKERSEKDVKKEKKIALDKVKKKEIIKKKESEKKKNPKEKTKETKKDKSKKEDKSKKVIKKKTLSKAHVDLDEHIKSSKKIDQMMDSLIEGEDGVDADEVATQVTASEVDAIIQTLYKCWHVPGGIRGASNMTVPVEIWVDKEGNITKHKVCISPTSPEMAAAIKSAERAVSDPRCQPLPIPQKKYDQFKNMIIDFNPKNMF